MKIQEYRNIVLVGSTSEIGLAILDKLKLAPEVKIYFVGRTEPKSWINLKPRISSEFINCDFEDISSINHTINKLIQVNKMDLLILAAGYLPTENSEFQSKTTIKSLSVNTIAPTLFLTAGAEKMLSYGRGDILVISSVAAIRPRIRNFTYGSSKAAIDFFSIGLANKLSRAGIFVCILRPGFVYTKMTTNFKPAVFAITPSEVGKITAEGLNKRMRIIYAPKKLKYVMKIVDSLPRFLFKLIE